MPKKAAKESVERLRKIAGLAQRAGGVTMRQLKAELEVSESTIKRDIDVLKDRMGCPIEYDKSALHYVVRTEQLPGGGPFELPGLWFNASEVHALLVMLHLLRGVQPGLLEPQLAPLKSRLRKLLGDGAHSAASLERRVKVIHFASRRMEVKHFELLVSALVERRRLRVRYFNRDRNDVTERELSPQQLVHYRENWFLDAWCHLRNDIRSFSVEAIQQVVISDLPAIEVEPAVLSAHFESGYGIYAGEAAQRAHLKFSPQQARYVSLETWHPRQTSSWLEDGSYLLEVPYSMDVELVRDLLRYGADVEVLGPPELRQHVADALRSAASKYDG
jgi:predicted DNA-binding transcriptional regulator YafY